jgi:hypothetical protein
MKVFCFVQGFMAMAIFKLLPTARQGLPKATVV